MNSKQTLIAYPVTAVVFLALDAIWLTTMAERLYRPALGRLMLDRFDLVLLFGLACDIDHFREVGCGEHLTKGFLSRKIATAAKRNSRIEPDKPVFILIDPFAQELGGRVPTEEPQRINCDLPHFRFAACRRFAKRFDRSLVVELTL